MSRSTVSLTLKVAGKSVSLTTRDCRRLLPALAALGEDCSEACKRLRVDLGKALTDIDTAPPSPQLATLYELFKQPHFAATTSREDRTGGQP